MAQTKTYKFKKKDDEPLLPLAISNPSKKGPYKFKKKDEGSGAVALIAVLLIMIIVFGGALLFILNQKPVDTPPVVVPNNTNVSNFTNQTNGTITPVNCTTDECIYTKAIDEDDYDLCLSILNSSISEMCHEHFAKDSLDACKLVTDLSKRKECVTYFAVSEKNALLCDLLLTDGVLECRVAVDPCYAEVYPDLCQALKASDPSKCKSNSDCLFNYSITKKSSSTCSQISDNVMSRACKSVVLSNDQCAPLPDDATQDYCYQLYAMYSDNSHLCDDIEDLESPYALDCYSHFATEENDFTICNALSLDQRWACYTNYALNTNDLTGCTAIHTLAENSRFQCIFSFAKKYGNAGACNAITDIANRKICYQGVIIYSNSNLDWHYCDDVISSDWSNKCFNEAAKLEDDISICDMIQENYAKEACVIAYQVNKTK